MSSQKIAVIGAGIIGSSIAYSLSKRNVEVHLIDKRKELNDPTLYSLAWLNAFRKTPLDYYVFYSMGQHEWPWFDAELGGGFDLTWSGALALPITSSGEKTLNKHVEPLFQWGYALERINKAGLTRIEPSLKPENVPWGIDCLHEGFVDAAKCTRRLIELAQSNGAKICRPKKVTGLIRKNKRLKAIVIDDEELDFDEVILACGETVSELAATASVAVPQCNTPLFFVETSPCQQRLNRTVWHIFGDGLIEMRQNPDGSFWIVEIGDTHSSYPDHKGKAQQLIDKVGCLFPPVKKLSYSQRVIIVPKPLDGKAIFGFAPGVENLYIALSHSAVVIASQIGRWVSQELIDKIPVHWLEQFRLSKHNQS